MSEKKRHIPIKYCMFLSIICTIFNRITYSDTNNDSDKNVGLPFKKQFPHKGQANFYSLF